MGCGSRTFPRVAMASDVSDVAIAVCQKHRAGEFIQEFFLGFDAAMFAFAGAGGLSASEARAVAVEVGCCSADARVRGAEACFGSSGGVAQAVLGSRDRQNRPEEPKVQTSVAAAAAVTGSRAGAEAAGARGRATSRNGCYTSSRSAGAVAAAAATGSKAGAEAAGARGRATSRTGGRYSSRSSSGSSSRRLPPPRGLSDPLAGWLTAGDEPAFVAHARQTLPSDWLQRTFRQQKRFLGKLRRSHFGGKVSVAGSPLLQAGWALG